ncbi:MULTISPECIES: branched-chain amino acid ABC transporter permease [unclassified Arthrobacter]|uniref:branched-chain amino acid ABC transporter permease n=1 Tax=unclassified Arthrobacter TaxID=235627 RepID=UPI001E48C1E9|nr:MULTISPECIES: branched-chain amino acid ABC transporter permease [unclassified Arthrobacter]MCC9146080.1 branched-chain amino acid ABC transporter permease [Arthrobacter sp. zg-Y919]MDK1277309.1 branched-chain amino acid ABC transporter permease [Arthrobacter sp. zg.Y919]MDM7990554.1 branched-chain amino acid ABC transporter permease [Arthrobacter sp. zg-Y877]WIB03813.1 branched-chain amino acid ABC transporter permease [Arthrobacter sp. zg-Y919]
MDFSNILLGALNEIISPTTAAYALAALGLAVHFGYTGLLNFGQAGFMAVGAYGFAIPILSFNAPLPLALLIALLGSVVFAVILGIPTLRLRADYLAIVTIAAAEIIRYVVTTNSMTPITGSANGLAAFTGSFYDLNPIPSGSYDLGPFAMNERDVWVRLVAWALVIGACFLVWLLVRSPWGRVVKGIREDENAVRALGKNVYAYKMQALVIGGVLGSLAGIVFTLPRGAVQPANYGTELTFYLYTALLLGGMSTVLGPVLGSMIFWVLLSVTQGVLYGAIEAGYITFISTSQAGQIRYILVGVALMLLMIFRPQGILGNKKELAFA